jgi:hypothetical protein
MRHHNLQVTGSVVVNGLGVATASELTAYTASADAKISTLQAFTCKHLKHTVLSNPESFGLNQWMLIWPN